MDCYCSSLDSRERDDGNFRRAEFYLSYNKAEKLCIDPNPVCLLYVCSDSCTDRKSRYSCIWIYDTAFSAEEDSIAAEISRFSRDFANGYRDGNFGAAVYDSVYLFAKFQNAVLGPAAGCIIYSSFLGCIFLRLFYLFGTGRDDVGDLRKSDYADRGDAMAVCMHVSALFGSRDQRLSGTAGTVCTIEWEKAISWKREIAT